MLDSPTTRESPLRARDATTVSDHNHNQQQQQHSNHHHNKYQPQTWWPFWAYVSLLCFDLVFSIVFLTPLLSHVTSWEGNVDSHYYTLESSLWDLAILTIPRLVTVVITMVVAYHRETPMPESPYQQFHENGERKSAMELEEEALQEPLGFKLYRHLWRMPFLCECSVLATGVLVSVKSLARLTMELGLFTTSKPQQHPVFWITIAVTATCALLEAMYLDQMERWIHRLGQQQDSRRRGDHVNHWMTWLGRWTRPLLRRMGSTSMDTASSSDEGALGQPLLGRDGHSDEERGDHVPVVDELHIARSDLSKDGSYNTQWSDLFIVCEPDKYWILLAVIFLIAASITNVYIPKFTGDVLDALLANHNTTTLTTNLHTSVTHIPGFVRNIELLLLVSILCGIFGGIRATIFTMIAARVNVRLRIMLMDSLLSQEIGFYDTTRTGDITSRLSSDTTLIGSSITSNVSVFLRAVVRGLGVLIFMFTISWQLSLLAFLTVPAVSILSKWYGRYLRRLTKLQQKKLAEGNSVSEAALSSMATVRAFGAEQNELDEFEKHMDRYLALNQLAAVATLGYSTCVNALPEVIKAVILFYGGLLVQNGSMSGGQLVSFILYLSSLSQAFNNLGGVYASVVRAVGAADKVFELMNRESKLTPPSPVCEDRVSVAEGSRSKHVLGVVPVKVSKQRAAGIFPESCDGRIAFENVDFRYPARPERLVLQGLNIDIAPGSIIALVGSSGSGKSSMVKLIHRMYDPSCGRVLIDGHDVHELSSDFMSRMVSVVSQQPILMARSVKRNIMYGLEGTDNEPSLEEIKDAARLANAASFIESLPEGYDTEVGERGIQLSGGQVQRIAIARALVRKPRVLLLDEATSALDSESEHMVQQAIDGMISGQRNGISRRTMTVIIIAHRLSTVRNADRIYVIEAGRVVEEGSHSELVQNSDGVYSALIRRQFAGMTMPLPSSEV